MAIVRAFRVNVGTQPGSLARVARTLADAGLNITGVAGMEVGSSGVLELMVDDYETALQAMRNGGLDFHEVQRIVASISESTLQQQGSLAQLLEALAGAGINLEALYSGFDQDGRPICIVGCNDPEKAEPIVANWGA